MTMAPAKFPVVVFFEDKYLVLDCDKQMTLADVKQQWQDINCRSISVAFFTHDEQHLSDELTIAEALASSTARSLELQAFPRSRYWLQVFGFEETRVKFEVADNMTPDSVRHEIARTLDIYTNDFRMTWEDAVLDQELPFKEQNFTEEAQLMVDLRVIMKISFDDNEDTTTVECFGSECIADLRQKLNLSDDTALIATSPYRRILANPLRVCYIVSDVMDLQTPIELAAEKKVLLAFEPVSLEHLRQKLPVSLSSTPIDLYDLVSERFQLTTEHRLAVNGNELDNSEPLSSQLPSINDVIQVDVLRPCEVFDLWEDPMDVNSYEEVYLYSTESPYALYIRDELNDQRLFHEDMNVMIFGSMVDTFGAVSGRHRPVLVLDRDVERSLPMLTFSGIEQKMSWAKNMLLDIVPMIGALPTKEVMHNGYHLPGKSTFGELRLTDDSLMIINPEKIFIGVDKKLRMCRFSHGATYGDVRARMQQFKGSLDVGLKTRYWEIPNEAMNRKLEREILYLSSENKLQTRLTVMLNNQWFGCWFEAPHVSFTDVMINIGKQKKIMPRHLFKHCLYCCGCGRQLSMKEEPHQTIPATCCSVKSLQLTDRRVKDVGIQAGSPRNRDAQTYTLDPESRDACVGTESVCRRAIVCTTPQFESTSTTHPSSSLYIAVQSPKGEREDKVVVVKGGNCEALLAAAKHQFLRVPVGDSLVITSQELLYSRNGKKRKALQIFDQKTRVYLFVDVQDGEMVPINQIPNPETFMRFLRCTSPLPSSPRLWPYLLIQADTEFFTVAPDRQLLPSAASALLDPSFLVLLHGVRSGKRLYWELPDLSLLDGELGKMMQINEIRKGSRAFVYALLRDKDPVPRINVPRGGILRILQRNGCHLRMEEGCLRGTGPPQATDIELWDLPTADKFIFHFEFTEAARKK